MNRVELEQALSAVQARIEAGMDGQAQLRSKVDGVLPVFAGTDLPARDVMRWLDAQIEGNMLRFPEIDPRTLAQGTTLNAFLFGWECGKRSK